ncbi:MAG TPA: hypothetical protein PKZ66_04050, partial [Chitinophagaceae bacterium]|nr:hypothetical protein [Chitinophagaceae bacterium]
EEKVSKKIEEKDFNEENKNKAKVVSNGNGNGAKSNKPDPTLSELVKNMPTQNQQQALPIKEQPKEEPKNPTISPLLILKFILFTAF